MDYLVVCKTDNKHYLLMTKSGEQYAIQAYHSKEEVLQAFSGFTEAWKRDATWSASACIGMMQMQPVAIMAPINAEDIKKYVIGTTITHVSGGVIGRGYHGLEVSEDILQHKQFDLWQTTMQLAGIMD